MCPAVVACRPFLIAGHASRTGVKSSPSDSNNRRRGCKVFFAFHYLPALRKRCQQCQMRALVEWREPDPCIQNG